MSTLTTITTHYKKFAKNQVLTEHQLNEFLDYFKDQDHLSRIGLSGVGIACGFQLSYNKIAKTITITQGVGVTSDGDLMILQEPSDSEEGKKDDTLKSIDLEAKTFTHFRKYENAEVDYSNFFFEGMELSEIIPSEEIPDGDTSYQPLSGLTGLDNMIAFLFLETYEKGGDLCNALTCDNQGIEQIARLKVMLTNLAGAEYMMATARDPLYNKHYWNALYESLPEIRAKRVILTCENTQEFPELKKNYFDAIDNSNTVEELIKGYQGIAQKFGKTNFSTQLRDLFDFSETAIPLDFQYRYDALKDIVDTYIDLKELLLHMNVECLPDIISFPKHLMLGKLIEDKPYKTFRHQFYKAPILGVEDANHKKALSLFERARTLVINYNNGNTIDEETGRVVDNGIRITPSKLLGKLENKAVPFYYHNNGLLDYWSYQRYINFTQQHNLRYNFANNSPDFVKEPLNYDISDNDFLRIEGLQGKMYDEVITKLTDIRKTKGLNFDIKALPIIASENQDLNIDDYRCEFEDLAVLHEAWVTEQNCVLKAMAKFFSGFRVDEVGANIREVEYTHPMGRVDREAILDGLANRASTAGAYYKPNVVKDNLTTDEKTIGFFIDKAIGNNSGGSHNDVKNAAKNEIYSVINQDDWSEVPTVEEFILEHTLELITLTWDLADKVPSTLSEIGALEINTFELRLEDICALVGNLEVTYRTVDLSDTLKDILAILINQLATICCSGEKLNILLTEIEDRKQRILQNIRLSEFVKKHPGLEHMAGVPNGGTFVIAYVTENTADQSTFETVHLDLRFLKQPVPFDGKKGDRGKMVLWSENLNAGWIFASRGSNDLIYRPFETVYIGKTLEETVRNLAEFLNFRWNIAGVSHNIIAIPKGTNMRISIIDKPVPKDQYYIQFSNKIIVGTTKPLYFDENQVIVDNATTENTVVADFALPYMCCTDCAPVNFIIAKEPTFLSLPKPFICLDENTEPLAFTVSPKDGEVKAVVEDGIVSGVVQDENGKYFFDAKLMDPSLYGQVIRFTVNGEETDAQIVVYNTNAITVSRIVVHNESNTQATVTFKVVGDRATITAYAWDLGNGDSSNDLPDENGVYTYIYELPANDENTVNPTLTITNGLCTSVVTIEPIEFNDPIDVNLNITPTVCVAATDDTAVPPVELEFTNLSPANGTIDFANGPVTGMTISGTTLSIDPNSFTDFDTLIAFTVNGDPTSAEITVLPVMEVSIIEDPMSFNWLGNQLQWRYFLGARIPDEVDENDVVIEWFIDGVLSFTGKNFTAQLPINSGVNEFDVILNVTGDNGCVAVATTTITGNYPSFSLSIEGGLLDYCLDDSNEYVLTANPNLSGTSIEGNGVSVNADGETVFIPANTGVSSSTTVTLMLNGLGLLTVNLHEPAVAALTATQVGSQIILKSLAQGDIVEWIWIVNDQENSRSNDDDFVIDLDDNSPTSWTFRLKVRTEHCKEAQSTTIRFSSTPVNRDCIPDTTSDIELDKERLSGTFLFSQNIHDNIVEPTRKLYDNVCDPNDIGNWLNGSNNSILLARFGELLKITAEALRGLDGEPFTNLSLFYKLQIKLFYNILHCQEADKVEAAKSVIEDVQTEIEKGLNLLKSANREFDSNNGLKNYLTAYSSEPTVHTIMKDFIIRILPEIL